MKVDNYDIKSIVTEIIPITEKSHPEEEYPMLKYFNLTRYKTIEDFIRLMDKNENYPLINQMLLDKPENYKMKYLFNFNEFINYMIEQYSFKISRDDAKVRILKNEEIFQNKEFEKKYKNFIISWNEIKSEAIKYKCRPIMNKKDLSPEDPLIFFLNDNGDIGGGMYLAAACQNFISTQNSFLQSIIDNNTFNGILHCYIDNIKKKIPLQEAKIGQILLIEERFNKSKYKDFIDIINSFSERNIFREDGKINYSDYNSFVYDYPSIEEELGKILLPGVCLFENEDELNFVAFWSEGFRGGRSKVLSEFYLKFPQKSLNDKEKENIINYIEKMNKKMKPNNKNYDFKEFFSSMQMIIFYLNEKGILNNEEKILNVLKNAPSYFKISDDCNDFFFKEGAELTVDKIMNIFFFIEHLCYEDLEKTLLDEYKEKIPENKKVLIQNKLLNNKSNQEVKYTTKELAAAIRRFISRYLVGKRQEIDIKKDRDLPYELSRIDLWEENIAQLENLEELLGEQLNEFNLKVDNAWDLYELIGEEDKKSIYILLKKKENKKYNKNYKKKRNLKFIYLM